MLGIDIIDLKDPLLKKRDKPTFRFITHPDDACFESEHAFWLLWTAKEAVFKAHRELTAFVPKEIPVQIRKNEEDQIIFISGSSASGEIIIHEDLIISLAALGESAYVEHHYFRKQTKNDSLEARTAIETYFSKMMNQDIHVVSDGNGLPILDFKHLPLSISHHGKFIAFAYPKLSDCDLVF